MKYLYKLCMWIWTFVVEVGIEIKNGFFYLFFFILALYMTSSKFAYEKPVPQRGTLEWHYACLHIGFREKITDEIKPSKLKCS